MFGSVLKFSLLCGLCGFLSLNSIFALDSSIYVADVDIDTAYCFQFTWLGPKWDNTTEFNKTCKDLDSKPCMEPLVITTDGSPPNTTHMWLNYDISQIACRLTKGETCTKWINYYANGIDNITYMCSKYTVDGESKTNWEGCEIDGSGSFGTEVCACRSTPGLEPCNSATHSAPTRTVMVLLVLLVVTVALQHT